MAPIAAFLAWDNRDAVRGMAPQPALAPALLGLPLAAAWFAAERLGVMEGRQLVALSFVELLFLVMLGRRLFLALSGPLLYLYFAVPFGAFVTPVLQSFTAWFIDAGLTVLGIPHFITDMVIEVTSGTFFVAEACAGLRFLIASVAFGVFFALLNYRSPGRRAAFIAVSIVVPIVANGVPRARHRGAGPGARQRAGGGGGPPDLWLGVLFVRDAAAGGQPGCRSARRPPGRRRHGRTRRHRHGRRRCSPPPC